MSIPLIKIYQQSKASFFGIHLSIL